LDPKFTKAVKQVFDASKFTGKVESYYSGGWNFPIAVNSNGQKDLCELFGNMEYGNYLFSPFAIVQACKTIFQDQPLTQTIGVTLPYGIGNEAGARGTGFSCTVINSYFKVNMMNNTARTFIVDVYDCEPKVRGTILDSTFLTDGVVVASQNVLRKPLAQWAQRVNDQQNMGQLNGAYLTTDYNNNPLEINGMKSEWNYNMKRIIIGPGQKENFFIQGPKNMEYHWGKSWKNGQFQDIDKWCKAPFIILRCENYTSKLDNNQHGIPAYTIDNVEGNVDPLLEFTGELCYKIQMPEQTGFNGATGAGLGIAALNQRRGNILRKYSFYDAAVGTEGITTLPENPITNKTQG